MYTQKDIISLRQQYLARTNAGNHWKVKDQCVHMFGEITPSRSSGIDLVIKTLKHNDGVQLKLVRANPELEDCLWKIIIPVMIQKDIWIAISLIASKTYVKLDLYDPIGALQNNEHIYESTIKEIFSRKFKSVTLEYFLHTCKFSSSSQDFKNSSDFIIFTLIQRNFSGLNTNFDLSALTPEQVNQMSSMRKKFYSIIPPSTVKAKPLEIKTEVPDIAPVAITLETKNEAVIDTCFDDPRFTIKSAEIINLPKSQKLTAVVGDKIKGFNENNYLVYSGDIEADEIHGNGTLYFYDVNNDFRIPIISGFFEHGAMPNGSDVSSYHYDTKEFLKEYLLDPYTPGLFQKADPTNQKISRRDLLNHFKASKKLDFKMVPLDYIKPDFRTDSDEEHEELLKEENAALEKAKAKNLQRLKLSR